VLNLYAQFAAVEGSDLGTAIRASSWLFPAIEAIHLLALALLGGSLLLLDLRLLGAGLTLQSTSMVERETRPWLITALSAMVVSGVLIGCSEALKLFDKPAFWVKMAALAVAVTFTLAIKMPLAHRDVSGAKANWLAILSIGLWLTVALAGRWIGFS
jgi:hypothetical protein